MNERWFAETRSAAELTIAGLMWRWDRLWPVTAQELNHWDTHILPWGWSVITDYRERQVDGTEKREDAS